MHAGQKPPVQDREAGEKTAGSGNGGSEAGPGEARLNSQVEREHAELEHDVEGQDAENRNETSRLDRVKSCWQDQEKLLRPTARTRRVQEQLQDALGVPVCTLGLYCLRFAYRWNLPELFYFPEVATPLPGSLPLGSHREPKGPALYPRAPFLADPEKSEREKRLGRYVEGKTFVQNGENEKEFSGGAVSLVAASKASSEYFPAPTHQQTSTRKYDCLSCRRTLRSPERAHSGGERIVVDTDGRGGGGGAEEEEDTARSDGEEGEKPDEKGDTEKRSEERELPRSGGQGNEADGMPDRLTAVFKPEGRQGWEVDHLISLLRTTLLIEDTGLLLRHRTSGADTVLTSQQAPSHRATGPASLPTSRGCEASSVIPRVFEFPSQDACVDATVAQVALREHQRRGEWGPFPSSFNARLGSERGDSETAKKGRTQEESDEGEGNEDECDREIRRQTSDGSTDAGRRETGEKQWGRLREEKNTRNGEKELGKKKRESRLVARDPNVQEATVEKEAKGRKRCRGRSRGERRKKKLQCKQAESCTTDSRPPPHLSRTDGSSHPSVCLPCDALTSHSFISSSSPACAFPSSPQAASFPPATASCSTVGAASRVRAAATNSESLEVEERKPRNASNLHKASAETGCANASPSQDFSSPRQGHQPPVKQNKEEHPRGEGTKANAAFKEKAGAKEGKVNPARSLYIQISGEPLTQARLCELRHIHCLASRAAARQRVRNRNAKQARQRGGDGSESEATGTVDREFGVPGAGRHEEEKKKGTLGPLGEAEEGEDRQGRDGDETQTHTRKGQKETPGLEGGGNRGGHATGPESGEVNLETENRGHRVSANSREKPTSRSASPSSPRPGATVPGEVEREKEMDGCKSRRDRRRLMALLRRRRRLATREAKRRSHLHRRLRSSGTSPSLALFSHKRETSPLFLNTQSSRQPGVRPSNLRLPRQLICHHSSFNKEGGLPSYALMSTLALRSAQRAAKGRSKGEAKHAETTADGGRSGEPNCVSPTRRKRRCEKRLKEATSQRDDKEDVKEKNRGGEDCGDGGIEARILTKFVLFSPLLFTPLTSAFGRCRGAAKVARAIGERTRETREVLGALRRRLRQMRTNGNGNAQQRIEGETEKATGALSAQPQVAHGNEQRSDEEQKNRTRIRQREAKEAENEEKNEIEMEKKMLKHVRQRLTKSVTFKSALSRCVSVPSMHVGNVEISS
uniref:RNA-directed DNA polymerase n=1 Tax=Toxoplasma gondii TgCATBr9 TaxID=943120 RepID=A0A2T6IS33_TOXGO|nr:RNA-directed DNA polymerase [Toxoplasma gondii TgCATBr9]